MADLVEAANDGNEDKKPDPKKALFEGAMERYKLAAEAWGENRKLALEDTKFRVPGNQWPSSLRSKRELAGRPCLEVDKGNQYIRQVVNDGRQNRPAVKVRPVDDKGDIKVAEAFQGLVRDICNKSNADESYDTALDHAATGGFGFFRVLTEYAHEKTFNQEIRVRRIRNPQSVLLDPNIQSADGSDAEWGFVEDDIPKAEFKRRWPNAKFIDFENSSEKYSPGWIESDNVRICEYFYRIEKPGKLHLLDDGASVADDDYQRAIAMGAKVAAIVETRDIPLYEVKWCRLSGAEVLEENVWLGKYIPIIPVFGNEIDVAGKVIYSGLLRAAKDALRLYNYSRSAYAERVAMTPKAPYIAAEEAVDDHPEWETANTENPSVLKYRAFTDDGNAIPMPSRQSASDIPEGFARDMQLAEHDIQASMGMYAASLGQQSNEKSGRAIMARQREGDTATFHYQDNLNRAIRYLGRQLVDLIPKVKDTKQAVRLLGEDGVVTHARIDPDQEMAVQEIGGETIYNLGVGQYDVDVEAGPSFTTRRVEMAEGMIAMTQANPGMWGTHGDLIAKAQDWPGAEEFGKRSLLTMPLEIRQALEAEKQGEKPEVAAIKAQASQAIAEKEQQLAAASDAVAQLQAENARLKEQAGIKSAEVNVKDKDADTKAYDAETKRMTALAPAFDQATVQMIVQQTVREIMAQPVPQDPGFVPPTNNQAPPGAFFTP